MSRRMIGAAWGLLLTTLAGCGGDDDAVSDAGLCGPCERPCCDYDQATGMTVDWFCPPEGYECGGPPIRDAGIDPPMDAGPTDSGACTDCIGATLEFGRTGGFAPYEDTSRIAACRDYTLTREEFGTSMTTTCTNEVPCTGDGVAMSEVLAALAHADVVAAFAAAPITYGRDTRPVDGQVFSVSQSGQTFLVGEPCGSAAGCTEIPAGVQALVDLLLLLITERTAEEDCASVFSGM